LRPAADTSPIIQAAVVLWEDLVKPASSKHANHTVVPNRSNLSNHTDYSWYQGFVEAQVAGMNLLSPVSAINLDVRGLAKESGDIWEVLEHLRSSQATESAESRDIWEVLESAESTESRDIWEVLESVESTESAESAESGDIWEVLESAESVESGDIWEIWEHPSRSGTNRRLLQSTAAAAVTRYSTLAAGTSGWSNIPVGNQMSDNWLEGPFGWPPKFDLNEWGGSTDCASARITIDILSDTGMVMKSFFQDYSEIRLLSWNILDNIPTTYTGIMPANTTLPTSTPLPVFVPKEPAGSDWAYAFTSFIGDNILKNYLGVGTESIVSFFTTAPNIPRDVLTARNLAKDMFMCDFESLMLCSRHNRRIFVSLVIAYGIYWILSSFLIRVGLPGIGSALFYAIPFVTLWLSYGLSPMCVPMIPTCIMADLVESVQVVLPAKITWPDSLQVYSGCLGPKWYDPNATIVIPPQFQNISIGSPGCMRSCKEDPFHFTAWESTLVRISPP
jgi:hypothetical protein